MSNIQQLPVLPLADVVVLPGMVVPVALDDPERQAAIDAAQSRRRRPRARWCPGSTGKYASVGVVATIEQLGKLPGGESAAVLRAIGPRPGRLGRHRARLGALGRG